MAEKSSFILYFSYKKHLALLSDEECGKLLMALFDYAENGQAPDLTGATAMAFSFIQDQMKRDANKYAAVCERNRKNGAKGGRPPKATKSENNPEKPKITERLSEKPKKPDNDYEYEYEYEYNNDNDITPPLPPAGDSVTPSLNIQEKRFNEFWLVYPKKVGKAAAQKAWLKLKPNTKLHEQIKEAIQCQIEGEQWKRENGRFIPNPTTWLNQRRWEDETSTPQPSTPDNGKPNNFKELTERFKMSFEGNRPGTEKEHSLSSGFKMATANDNWGSENVEIGKETD